MNRKRFLFLLLAATVAGVMVLGGCSDDDDNPTNPGGGGSDQFDQTTAQAQAQASVPQAVMLAENVDEIAAGVDSKSGTYTWNEELQRWEFHNEWSYMGYSYVWDFSVQYLDESGNPVQHRADAYSARHIMDGTGHYHSEEGGTSVDWNGTYQWDVTISGLHTATYTATGGGTYTADYTVSSQGFNMSRHFVVDWEILDPGLVKPAGGCPTGTIRYTMTPYVLDVVFDGTDTASWILKDGNGGTVDSGTTDLDCGVS